ncbi:hypothetical protein EFB08_06860 [Rufibacter latericius]|uniref:Uncharacterized protein n=1 Tax=Rufibacter latericius TaxID=2487040 RepID=A0A3M9MUE0_9BACT|nr:hypothetical protein EFB08_06860 [Rufibacter latericius]
MICFKEEVLNKKPFGGHFPENGPQTVFLDTFQKEENRKNFGFEGHFCKSVISFPKTFKTGRKQDFAPAGSACFLPSIQFLLFLVNPIKASYVLILMYHTL